METSANGSHPKPAENNPLDKEDDGTSPKKNLRFVKKIGSLRTSKKSLKKPNEGGELSSPEKEESLLVRGQNVRSSKVFLKRQSNVDEPKSPDMVEAFGSLVSRLSKRSPNKLEKMEDVSSPESKGAMEGAGSLVDKWRRSIRGKKKIDYNGAEKSLTSEEPRCEDEEEPQMLSGKRDPYIVLGCGGRYT